jgi:hypothetical protein
MSSWATVLGGTLIARPAGFRSLVLRSGIELDFEKLLSQNILT